MKALLTGSETTNSYSFVLEFEEVKYSVQVWLNQKGKFIDESICFESGEELEYEGSEGETRTKIMNYLDENWESLTK